MIAKIRYATLTASLMLFALGQSASAQTTVFNDTFTSPTGTFPATNGQTFTSGTPTATYTVSSTLSTGAAATGNVSLPTGTSSGVIQINTGGSIALTTVTAPTSTFSTPFNTTLANNTNQIITYTFNMRQTRTDPSGFDNNNYGAAVILGATSADLRTASGYAVTIGQSGGVDQVRLVRFVNGIDANANLTTVTAPSTDYANQFLSVRVQYNTATSEFTIGVRNDSVNAPFTDPTSTTANPFDTSGPMVDTTYTNVALTNFGFAFNHATGATDFAQFDNFSVAVAPIPEPGSMLGLGAAGLGLVRVIRRRRRMA